MKRIITAFALAVAFAVPVMGQAEVPTYVTKTASGTTTAAVYFATSPYQQARIVGAIASSDLSGANMTFRTGSTPLSIIKTNAAGTTIDVGATNGFAAGDWVVVETAAGVMTNGVIASFKIGRAHV